jgi:hypothetical protein
MSAGISRTVRSSLDGMHGALGVSELGAVPMLPIRRSSGDREMCRTRSCHMGFSHAWGEVFPCGSRRRCSAKSEESHCIALAGIYPDGIGPGASEDDPRKQILPTFDSRRVGARKTLRLRSVTARQCRRQVKMRCFAERDNQNVAPSSKRGAERSGDKRDVLISGRWCAG